jgi:hypothetical protein
VNRRIPGGILAILVVAGIVGAVVVLQPRTPEQRLETARAMAGQIHATPTVAGATLLAASAIADFGVGAEVRLVRVRVVDELQLRLQLESASDVRLGRAPRLCLVGPYSAPDDAGLSDRCWGEPDLGAAIGPLLETDGTGLPMLAAGQPVDASLTIRRGAVRCDYAPGTWVLEVWVAPIVDGVASEDLLADEVQFEVPIVGSAPLLLADHARYCGLASAIYREQGEPDVVAP